MWWNIWKWIKRIIFFASMIAIAGTSILMFDENLTGLSRTLNIVLIILALGSCFLYFVFNEYKKWPVVLILCVLLGLSLYLSNTIEGSSFILSVFLSIFGIIVSVGIAGIFEALNKILDGMDSLIKWLEKDQKK